MAKEELFKIPILKNLIKLYGAYPVNRTSADRQAIRSAMAALEQGWAVGIFLEGTRTNDAKVNDPKLGAALIAAKSGVGALPVSLWGTEKVLKKGSNFPSMVPLTIRIGQIIPPPRSNKKEDLLKFTQDCANSINHLHDLGR
jgi:1-acyl-sn-glycerol-3-phosphate acyltransferase